MMLEILNVDKLMVVICKLADSDIVYPVKSSSSLVQLQESVEEIIKSALTQPSVGLLLVKQGCYY